MSIPGRFSKVLQNGFKKTTNFSSVLVRNSSLWEPDYLIYAKTKTPEYDAINVQIKGFDFAVLEKYQGFIHKIAKNMNIDVEDCWATPFQHLHVKKYTPNSSKVDSEYYLKIYERNVQVIDVKSHILPLFIEAVITACPPGVKLSVHEHQPEIESVRFVPDLEIKELQQQLDEIGDKKKNKKKEKR